MIIKKEFFFVRHGQTDHNISADNLKGDHPPEIPLNATGRLQATTIASLISTLPVDHICVSPMRRAQETKEIAAVDLALPHFDIHDLSECTTPVWKGMYARGLYSSLPEEGPERHFMDRVRSGINHALSFMGTPLIIAHGGVHWAVCCLIGIQDHHWAIDNCTIVHFSLDEQENWKAVIICEKKRAL